MLIFFKFYGLSESKYFPMAKTWFYGIIQTARRPMDFNAIGYELFIDKYSDSTIQLISKKIPLDAYWYNIKEEMPQFSTQMIKLPLLFPTTHLYETGFSSYA